MGDFGNSPRYITSTSLTVILLEPWGSGNCVGLTGLEVVTLNQQKVSLTPGQIAIFPRELMNVGWEGMVGNFGALFDGVNQTTDVNHMWLVPALIEGKHPMIQIRFPVLMPICGVRVFNFNSNATEAFNGAKFIQIFCNGSMIGVRFTECFSFYFQNSKLLIRKAPGVSFFDYSQYIPLIEPKTCLAKLPSLRNFAIAHSPRRVEQDFVCPLHPCGFVLKLQIESTWGDRSFVGLYHLEVLDPSGTKIDICPQNIHPFPAPQTVLYDNNRTYEPQMINIQIGTWGTNDSWCVPIVNSGNREEQSDIVNCLFVLFDVPVIIGCVKVLPRGIVNGSYGTIVACLRAEFVRFRCGWTGICCSPGSSENGVRVTEKGRAFCLRTMRR